MSEPVRSWFTTTFGEPTPAQQQGWPQIASGSHTLILAPTGSGKTLAAFLWGIDRLSREPRPEGVGTRIVYISPLRALAVDVDKNLRSPLAGIRLAGERLGVPVHTPTVGIRTGDTPANERRTLARHPPDILITTPESLYLMLTSSARDSLRHVEHVIIDEIHALAATKRGAHLSLSLERLEEITERSPQRIGLSATQRPLDEIARFLGGRDDAGDVRPVSIVDAGVRKPLEIEVIVPVDDMGQLGQVIEEPTSGPAAAGPVRRSIWPSMHPRLLELVQQHRSTIIFVNARRLAERLAARLNELAAEQDPDRDPDAPPVDLVMAHHGSLSRERRLQIEDQLKSGRLRGLVATSSLELGIDMGAVDLVIQVESPGAVSRGLQRVGRAGHQVGEPSRGRFFPKHRSDLVEAATVVDRMRRGLIESTRYPRNPLDVLAQQIVAMCALDDWPRDRLATIVRRSANFAEITDDVFTSVLDLLSGRYPSEEFAELRPRIVWDRVTDTLRGRAGSQRLAVTSGGTIPDRGLFGVFLPDGVRVGELDEEMVYESRAGETFLLGASTWRIEEITHERVIVTPAPGQPGKMPFWRGDGPGRPFELGEAVGELVRTVHAAPRVEALARLRKDHGLDELAAHNLVLYLDEQAEATGVVPDDRTIVVERFRDEIGDWRVCIHSPFGAQVHAPWAIALRLRLGERWGDEPELLWSDDGIVIRLPAAIDEFPLEELSIDPAAIDDIVIEHLPSTALFTSRFREAASRALLLPRRRPDQRTPLWQQRQRAANLLQVAVQYPQFPLLLEATREICNDVFDLPALRRILGDIRSRKVRVVPVDTARASPMAQSLLFGWIAVYMYEYDAPLAERRAAALGLDRDLLRELLGAEELRELIDADVLADLELELQRCTPERRARDADELHDHLRVLGPLSRAEIDLRAAGDATEWITTMLRERRAIEVVIAGEARIAAADDAARLRDALGVALPQGLPAVFTDPVEDPLGDLVSRYARTHGPFLAVELAARFGLDPARVRPALERLGDTGRIVLGEFRPGGLQREWCDDEVLRQLRRRSLAALRREIEPVDGAALARFLPAWQGIGGNRQGLDGLVEALGTLQGAAIPASALEVDVLASRVRGYRPADLDSLCTAGEVVWIGAGAIGSADGRVGLYFRDQVALLAPDAAEVPDGPLHDALLAHLSARGASFWPEIVRAAADAGQLYDDPTVLAALWDLVWAGHVTNDSIGPLRAQLLGRPRRTAAAASRRPRPGRLTRLGPPAGAGRWSLVSTLLEPRPAATERAHARARQLLERYGVLTRESVVGEGVAGGFAGLYPVLEGLESRGQTRRGYFVAGLGAAQFALPGAVDRLRSDREPDPGAPLVLAATDPAQPFGAALPWPETAGSARPARAAGAFVVLRDGAPLVYVERGGRAILRFPAAFTDQSWTDALMRLVKDGRMRVLEIARVDGSPVRELSDAADALRAAGFVDGYRGLVARERSGR